jgi:hypothetical protein
MDLWYVFAQVAPERLDEMQDPELSIDTILGNTFILVIQKTKKEKIKY